MGHGRTFLFGIQSPSDIWNDGGVSTFVVSNLHHDRLPVLEIDFRHVQVFNADGVGEYFSFDLAALKFFFL
jgi:hypothetical protein